MSNNRNNTNDTSESTGEPVYNKGVIYSDGSTSDGINNGSVGEILTSTGSGTAPVWAPSASFPGIEGIVYNNSGGTTITIPTTPTTGEVLTSNGFNPIWSAIPSTEFIKGTDTPGTYAGTALFDVVNVDNTLNGVQFTSLPNLISFTTPLEKLSNTPATNPPAGQVLTSTGLGSWVGSDINFNSLINNLNVLDTFTNDIIVPSFGTNDYLLDLNFTTENNGFTLNLPHLFRPSINKAFNIVSTFNFRLAKTSAINTGSVLLSIYIVNSSNTIIATLVNNNYPLSSLPVFPTYATFTINDDQLVTLNSSTQYKYKIELAVSASIGIHYNKKNKHLIASAKTDQNIIDNQDYLSVGYPSGVMVCNGLDGFNVINGNNNDVLQIVNDTPTWVPLDSADIPDPLLVNNINEKTLNGGVIINTNTKITPSGIIYPNNTALPFPSTTSTMNTYYNSAPINAFWTDSATLLSIGTTPAIAYYSKIGQLVFITVGNFASTVNFAGVSSYPTLSNIVMNGETIPISTTFRQPFVYNNNAGGVNRTDCYIEYDNISRYFIVKSTNRADGGLNGGGFAHDQFTLCFLGSS
jgi:hypothetical protein